MSDSQISSAMSATGTSVTTILKLLSGPQLGAEVRLDDGDYLIGSDADCDLVLFDDSVAAHHLRLRLNAGQVSIRLEQGEVIFGGRRLGPGTETGLPLGSVMALGTSFVAIGAAGTDWLKLPLPDLRQAGAEDKAPDAIPPVEEAADAELAPSDAAIDSSSLDDEPRSASGHGVVWTISSVLALTLGLALYHEGWSLWGEGNAASAQTVAAAPSPKERLTAILAAEGFSDLSGAVGPDGGLILRGYVASLADKKRLAAALAGGGIEIDNRVWADERVARAIDDTLDRLGAGHLEHRYIHGGELHLQGYFDGDMSSEELVATVRNDVPAISKVEADIRTLADALADLRERVRDAGLAQQVGVAEDGGRIAASGTLGPVRMASWRKVASDFVVASGGKPPLESRVRQPEGQGDDAIIAPRMQAEQAPSLQLSVRGVMIGKGSPGYALLGNGSMVSVGDALSDGYRIKSIAFDRIVVGKQAKQWIFYVGQNR